MKELIEKASYSTKAVTINTKHFQKMKVTKPTFSSSATDNHELLVVDPDETEYTKDKIENPVKKMKIDTSRNGKKEWLRVGGIKLTINDRDSITRGERLNDMVINVAQRLLKSQFPKIKGLNSTLLQAKKTYNTFENNKVQIIHSRGDHWIVAATVGGEKGNQVKVYDSLYESIDDGTHKVISNIFGSLATPHSIETPKQSGVDDCGLYAIANATSICHNQNPAVITFDQSLMRLHLTQCIDKKMIAPFPSVTK